MSKLLSDQTARHCEVLAGSVRAQLSLTARERLEPRALASQLGIEVVDLTTYWGPCPREVVGLTATDPTALSAVTIHREGRYRIIVNPNHPAHSAEESIRHELAHVLLGHEPRRLFNQDCERIWDTCDEAQADYLAFALAVSKVELERMSLIFDHDVVALAKRYDAQVAIVAQRLGRPVPRAEDIPVPNAEPSADTSGVEPAPDSLLDAPRHDSDGGTPAPAPSPAA